MLRHLGQHILCCAHRRRAHNMAAARAHARICHRISSRKQNSGMNRLPHLAARGIAAWHAPWHQHARFATAKAYQAWNRQAQSMKNMYENQEAK
jgi:hypothetical protein